MRFRRCGSASGAWRARASRTSRERRPMEGPQRTSGGDALGSPERPRPSVAGRNRLRGGRCLVAGLFRHKTGQRCHLNKAAKNSQRSSSTRRPLRLINCSPGEVTPQARARSSAQHHYPAQRGGARCGSDGVVLQAKPGGRKRAEPRVSEGPWRGRSERPAETRWAPPSDHALSPSPSARQTKPRWPQCPR
jgi:hypothetical protein